MNLSDTLRSRFYPRFTPKIPINSYILYGWKILVLNAGSVPGKPVLCKRADGKEAFLSFKDLETGFLTDFGAVAQAQHNGFKLVEKFNDTLKFTAIRSET